MDWIRKITLLVLLPLLALPAPAFAEQGEPRGRYRAAGEIISVDVADRTFELSTRRGDELTVFVTDDTAFRSIEGDIQEVGDLEVGMKAFAVGEAVEGGVSARVIGAARPGQLEELKRFAGEVVRINPGLEQFTLENRAGEGMVLTVDERTRFRSRHGDVDSFEDLERGMHALAVYREVDGVNLALRVGVRGEDGRPRLPKVDVRVAGRITAIDDESVTIQGRRGRDVTMSIAERTVLRARGGGEPQEGDFAIALGKYDGGGDITAILVIAFPGRGPAEEGSLDPGDQGFGAGAPAPGH